MSFTSTMWNDSDKTKGKKSSGSSSSSSSSYAKIRSSSFSDSIDRCNNNNNNNTNDDDHEDHDCYHDDHGESSPPRRRTPPLSPSRRVLSSAVSSSSTTTSTTPTNVIVSRSVTIPDQRTIDRCQRLPEFGPVILFFSGGTAIKDLSSTLIHYTYNSIHLITPFDSGGSSAEIRRTFDMLSVGDLRNRLLALSDPKEITMVDNPYIPLLLGHRLAKEGSTQQQLRTELESIIKGRHILMKSISLPMRSILQSHLRWFYSRMPDDFDLRGASIGNLTITGCFLEHERDIVTAIFLISKFLAAKGVCRPLTAANLHIRTFYDDGSIEVGQHKMNESAAKKKNSERCDYDPTTKNKLRKIVDIDLVEKLQDHVSENGGGGCEADGDEKTTKPQESQICHVDMVSADLISSADLIVFPMGSFFASLIVNLLPRGVGNAIVTRKCPKVYIPNTGFDPEMNGYTLLECIDLIVDMVRKDGGEDVPVKDILNFVLLDTQYCDYKVDINKTEIEGRGITIIDVPLVNTNSLESSSDSKSQTLDPGKIVEVLLSLSN